MEKLGLTKEEVCTGKRYKIIKASAYKNQIFYIHKRTRFLFFKYWSYECYKNTLEGAIEWIQEDMFGIKKECVYSI